MLVLSLKIRVNVITQNEDFWLINLIDTEDGHNQNQLEHKVGQP